MIMYFDFSMYFRMVRLAFREKNRAGRRRLFFTLFVLLPVVSSFTAICFFLDGIFFPGLHRLKVRKPVFIVGHARSGTTLMHRILSRDVERFSYFLFYEMFFPSLLQKKCIRFLAWQDRKFWGSRIEKKLRAWETRKFAASQDSHKMGLTLPEEDDFILTLSCASGFWITLLPYMGKLDFYYIDERSPRGRRGLMKYYAQCLRRQLYLNGRHKQHLSKNPTFCGRVESLIETFPDARIVYMARNPLETIPSLLKLMKLSWAPRGWTEDEIRDPLNVLARQSFHSYKHPLEVLARHPETKHAIIDYRELVSRPKHVVQQIYRQLDLPLSPAFEHVLDEEQARARKHVTGHSYSLEEFGLRDQEIRDALPDLFERFQWETGASHTAAIGGE